MIVRLQDNPHIIVKPETYPITVTGATYYNFIESGATTITKVQSGNIVDVTIYNPSGSSATWGMIVGDITNQTDLTDYVSQSISAATSGITSSWSGLTGLPSDNVDLNAILTGMTADIQANTQCCTGNTADIDYHYQQFTAFTDYVYTLIVPASSFHSHTDNTLIHFEKTDISYSDLQDLPTLFSGDYDDLTNKPDLSVYQPVSGMSIYLTGVTWNDVTDKPTLFTGNTFTASGITQITQVGDNVNIYVPADAITGVTWGSITGTLSGQTDLWNVLAEKVDSQVYHDDLQTLSDTIDSNATGVTATFVTLTGTTLPATYLTLSDFNTFSGTTLPANYYTQTAADALLVDKVDWVLYQDDLQGIYEAISGITSGLTTTLSGCTDVTITSPADNDILKYSGGTWINETSVDLFTSVNDGDLLQRSGTTVIGIAISGLTIPAYVPIYHTGTTNNTSITRGAAGNIEIRGNNNSSDLYTEINLGDNFGIYAINNVDKRSSIFYIAPSYGWYGYSDGDIPLEYIIGYAVGLGEDGLQANSKINYNDEIIGYGVNTLDDIEASFDDRSLINKRFADNRYTLTGTTAALQSAINTYTGTTAPNSFLPITGLTGYWTSAQTENYVTGLGYLTGYTVTADDVTGITATLYSPTGHTHSTYVEKIATIVTLTASTILDSSYASKIVEVNSTGNTTITLYSGATIGTRIDIVNVNTGDVTLAAQGTLQSDGTKLATQYTGASVYARGTSTWLAVGKLTT